MGFSLDCGSGDKSGDKTENQKSGRDYRPFNSLIYINLLAPAVGIEPTTN